MEIKIEIPEYEPGKGLPSQWFDDFEIETFMENSRFVISANKDGLLSLAAQL